MAPKWHQLSPKVLFQSKPRLTNQSVCMSVLVFLRWLDCRTLEHSSPLLPRPPPFLSTLFFSVSSVLSRPLFLCYLSLLLLFLALLVPFLFFIIFFCWGCASFPSWVACFFLPAGASSPIRSLSAASLPWTLCSFFLTPPVQLISLFAPMRISPLLSLCVRGFVFTVVGIDSVCVSTLTLALYLDRVGRFFAGHNFLISGTRASLMKIVKNWPKLLVFFWFQDDRD